MLLLIDNFDSFTFNIVHAFEKLGVVVHVVRNNAATVDACFKLNPHYIVVGPGPGNPAQAGISKDLIARAYLEKIPLLGICLGHQAIGEVFGANVVKAQFAMHGKVCEVLHHNRGIFHNLPKSFKVTRYHSLIVAKNSFPDSLEITAYTQSEEIMGLRHLSAPIEGVQFHPESIASEYGLELLTNFLNNN